MVTDLILTRGTHWFPFENGIIKKFTLFSFHLYSAILIKCLESICNITLKTQACVVSFFWFLASWGSPFASWPPVER